MFKKLVLNNFKCFSHFEIDLSKNKNSKKAKNFVLIYGENGVGKSSVLDALVLLKKTAFSLNDFFSFSKFFADNVISQNVHDLFANLVNVKQMSFRIGELARNYIRIGSDKETSLEYEGVLNEGGMAFRYCLAFNKEMTTWEELWINDEKVFSSSKESLEPYLNELDFIDPASRKSVLEFAKMYYGHHSLLSCIEYATSMMEQSFSKAAISKRLLSFIDMLERIEFRDIKLMGDLFVEENAHTRSNKVLPNLARGIYEDSYEERKKRTITLLNEFYCSLYQNIVGVDYDISPSSDGKKKYSLVFVEKAERDETIRVPYYLESTGTQNLLALLTFLMASIVNDRIIIIDEIDTGINDILLKDVISSIQENIKGQFIATTHNTLLMAYSIKNGCYILNRKENQEIESYSLDSFGRKIQAKTDVSGGYQKGNYGGVPDVSQLSVQKLIDIINQ